MAFLKAFEFFPHFKRLNFFTSRGVSCGSSSCAVRGVCGGEQEFSGGSLGAAPAPSRVIAISNSVRSVWMYLGEVGDRELSAHRVDVSGRGFWADVYLRIGSIIFYKVADRIYRITGSTPGRRADVCPSSSFCVQII